MVRSGSWRSLELPDGLAGDLQSVGGVRQALEAIPERSKAGSCLMSVKRSLSINALAIGHRFV
jgi:hypothetical protein